MIENKIKYSQTDQLLKTMGIQFKKQLTDMLGKKLLRARSNLSEENRVNNISDAIEALSPKLR